MIIHRNKDGFTLVEILVVVALIAILATIVVGVAGRIDGRAKENALEGTFVLLDSALQEYRRFTDKFPEQPENNPVNAAAHAELLYDALNSVPDSRTILEKIDKSSLENRYGAAGTTVGTSVEIYDPWGMPVDYRYSLGENFPVMTSAEPDKVFGTADDMSSK
ncbi:MAG: prepilin-type N-terminal cleavage/methylation domain-containing protein [Planctomycetota bacterium]|jgi:prepilin-type N-terminal cleavage/methylation domain-containing protein